MFYSVKANLTFKGTMYLYRKFWELSKPGRGMLGRISKSSLKGRGTLVKTESHEPWPQGAFLGIHQIHWQTGEIDQCDLPWKAGGLAITSVFTEEKLYKLKLGFLLPSESGLLYLHSWGIGLDEISCHLKGLVLGYFLFTSHMNQVVGKRSYSLLFWAFDDSFVAVLTCPSHVV